MRYVIFDTKFGFCGILAEKGGILRTSLPVTDLESATEYLLSGLQEVQFDPDLMPYLQNQIKTYFSGTYVEFDENVPLQLAGLSKFSQDIL
jgi:O6-methylguanine-DNA--protein-cysteine methyltransferase